MLGNQFFENIAKDPASMKQADHIWKMLDEMAESNPEQYQTFIKQNIAEGAKEMKEEQEKQEKSTMIKPEEKFTMKMPAKLIEKPQQNSKLMQDLNIQEDKVKENRLKLLKVDKETKIYINLLTHEDVIFALDQNKQELKVEDDIRNWYMIPLSISNPMKRKSSSFNHLVYQYDIVMNDQVYNKIIKSMSKSTDYFKHLLVSSLQQRIEQDKNPLREVLDFSILNTDYHYQIQINSVVNITNKKYKSLDKKPLQLINLEVQVSKRGKALEAKKQEFIVNQKINLTQKDDLSGIIPQIEKNIESMFGKQEKPSGKKLIEEIPEVKQEVQQKKEPVSPVEPQYQILQNDNKLIELIIKLPLVDKFQDIDLDLSRQEIKLKVKSVYDFKLQLQSPVDNNNPIAKWDKKTKTLSLKLIKQ